MSDYASSAGGALRALGMGMLYRGYAARYVPLLKRGWTDIHIQDDANHAQILEAILIRNATTFDIVPIYEPLPAETTVTADTIARSVERFFSEALESGEVDLVPGEPRLTEEQMVAIEKTVAARRPDLLDEARALRTECFDRLWLAYAPPNAGGGIEVESAVAIGQALWSEIAAAAIDLSTGQLSDRGRLLARAAHGLPLGFRTRQ